MKFYSISPDVLLCFRHEMQYLVRVLQGYLANQVIHVTWLELREDLGSNVHNLDDLHNCHGNYLNKCLSRSVCSLGSGDLLSLNPNLHIGGYVIVTQKAMINIIYP